MDTQDTPGLAAVLAAQEILVLRRIQPGVLTIIPPAPHWLARFIASPESSHEPRPSPGLRPPSPRDAGRGQGEGSPARFMAREQVIFEQGASQGTFPTTELFPYLESCLPEAEAIWKGQGESQLSSGIWTEPIPGGGDLHLEATALRVDQGAFLLIRRADREHAARQQVLQLARERMLDHERLLEEISAKEILLHCIVHDLAGPLAGMQGCLEMLANSSLGASEADFVQMGLLQAGRQQRLIRDILDVFAHPVPSRQPHATDLSLTHDLCACVDEVTEGLRPAFLAKRVNLKTIALPNPTQPRRVVAEASRLERVLYNLLENALRFSPVLSTVTVQLHEEEHTLGVTVSDEGPGVAPEIMPHLFHRFISGGRWPGKSGLGLFFCRITLEPWGGSITCLPGEEGGACFKIQLRKVIPPSVAPTAANERTPGYGSAR